MFLPAFVCLSVCLSVSKITQKRVHGFGWNVVCQLMSGHGRTFEPDPDCFLQYRIGYGTLQPSPGCQQAALLRGIYVGKIPRLRIGGAPLQRAVVLIWFYSLSRRKTFVGGKCALPSALLVMEIKLILTFHRQLVQILCAVWHVVTMTSGSWDKSTVDRNARYS